MKKVTRFIIILLTISFMVSCPAFAKSKKKTPKGFKVVTLTKSNFSKYFGLKKIRKTNALGEYSGYSWELYSKMTAKGYYIYSTTHAVRLNFTENYKYISGTETKEETTDWSRIYAYNISTFWSIGGSSEYDYKYSNISPITVVKAIGKVVFIKKSNVSKYNKKKGCVIYKKRYKKKDLKYKGGKYFVNISLLDLNALM